MKINNIIWKKYTGNFKLNLDAIHIFKINIDNSFTEIRDVYKLIISENEIAKSNRYNKNTDHQRYIVGKFFLRLILSKFKILAPEKIVFHQKENKKPSVPGIEFNVTHSGNILLIAISANPIGIDIEFINQSFDHNQILRNCFDLDEIDFINTKSENLLNFYTLWTRKEALLKSTGEGLIDKLDQINCLDDLISRNKSDYHLISNLVNDNYVMSIASSSLKQIDYWEANYSFLK